MSLLFHSKHAPQSSSLHTLPPYQTFFFFPSPPAIPGKPRGCGRRERVVTSTCPVQHCANGSLCGRFKLSLKKHPERAFLSSQYKCSLWATSDPGPSQPLLGSIPQHRTTECLHPQRQASDSVGIEQTVAEDRLLSSGFKRFRLGGGVLQSGNTSCELRAGSNTSELNVCK